MGQHLVHGDNEGDGRGIAGAAIGMRSAGVEVGAVAGAHGVNAVTVANLKLTLQEIEEFVARVDVGAYFGGLFGGDEFGVVGIELTVGHHVGQTLEIVGGIVDAGLRQADALAALVDAEERVGFRLEEVGEIAAEDHGDACQVAKGGDDAAGFKLGEETGGETCVAAELDQAHGALEAQAPNAFANSFFCDEGVCRGGVAGRRVKMRSGRFKLVFHGLTVRQPLDFHVG